MSCSIFLSPSPDLSWVELKPGVSTNKTRLDWPMMVSVATKFRQGQLVISCKRALPRLWLMPTSAPMAWLINYQGNQSDVHRASSQKTHLALPGPGHAHNAGNRVRTQGSSQPVGSLHKEQVAGRPFQIVAEGSGWYLGRRCLRSIFREWVGRKMKMIHDDSGRRRRMSILSNRRQLIQPTFHRAGWANGGLDPNITLRQRLERD